MDYNSVSGSYFTTCVIACIHEFGRSFGRRPETNVVPHVCRIENHFYSWIRSYRDATDLSCCVVYPLPWPLLVGGVRCSRLWSTSQLLRPSGQQCSHSGGVCPQIQGRQCGAYVGAVEEMMCVVCVDVTEGA